LRAVGYLWGAAWSPRGVASPLKREKRLLKGQVEPAGALAVAPLPLLMLALLGPSLRR
jgi:hypothetical protein